MSSRIAVIERDSIRVTRALAIPFSEVQLRFSRSSGPGGQHAQKTETRVEAVFDVEASATLSAAQKKRVVEKLGPVVRAVSQDERSQSRNRELALERLGEAIAAGLKVRRRRRPSKPPPEARERRLAEKRRRAETKRLRDQPGEERTE
jgi:ribosome-associated protein